MRVVITSVPCAAAEEIAARLVEERAAACGTVLPGAKSVYWWKGATVRSEESLVVLKTSDSKASTLVRRLRELHPYEVPEILSIAPEAVLAAYEEWVAEAVDERSGA